MERILRRGLAGIIILILLACSGRDGRASMPADMQHGLILSDMQVEITSMGHVATFRLYDTVAAKEFYDQLPLKLDLSNFRDAQWMFYPPERLNVTARKAYHDGEKVN